MKQIAIVLASVLTISSYALAQQAPVNQPRAPVQVAQTEGAGGAGAAGATGAASGGLSGAAIAAIAIVAVAVAIAASQDDNATGTTTSTR